MPVEVMSEFVVAADEAELDDVVAVVDEVVPEIAELMSLGVLS